MAAWKPPAAVSTSCRAPEQETDSSWDFLPKSSPKKTENSIRAPPIRPLESCAMPEHHEDNRPVEAAQRAVAIASHDIRGSLAAIVAHAELVVDGELSPERQEEVTRLIARNGRSLLALLDDVVFASRIDAGAERAEPSPCSVHELLDDLVDLHAPEAEARGLFLELEIDRTLPASVRTDGVHLRRVLMNLASNAIKFTEQGGVRLRAEYAEADSRLLISVEDTGVGLQQVELERIFEPFIQSEDRLRDRPGSGLGLAIVRELTALLGGEVSAQSEPGVGSTFHLSIPVEVCTVTPGCNRLDGVRVLCAEDCPDSRLLMQHHLEALGAHVGFADDGLALLEEWNPVADDADQDVILVDLEMPRMGGLEATAALRARGCDVPVLVLTAHPVHLIEDEARAHGCNGCLAKPIDPIRLAREVNRLRACVGARRTG